MLDYKVNKVEYSSGAVEYVLFVLIDEWIGDWVFASTASTFLMRDAVGHDCFLEVVGVAPKDVRNSYTCEEEAIRIGKKLEELYCVHLL